MKFRLLYYRVQNSSLYAQTIRLYIFVPTLVCAVPPQTGGTAEKWGTVKNSALCSGIRALYFQFDRGWRRGVVVSGVRRMNEVNARRARLAVG